MANKLWSVLFGVVMLACALSFVVAPFVGWWMPAGASSHAHAVDFLFYVIYYITAFFFILTEAILAVFLWVYCSSEGKRPVSESAETVGMLKPLTGFLHNQHRVELAWTFVPAVILLYIAFAQVSAWADIKYEIRREAQKMKGQGASMQIGVSARQFEWRMRYPSVERFQKWMDEKVDSKADFDSFGKVPQADDNYVVNELHIWQDYQVVVHLTTRDVIHSFNLPNFRVKQDALPGKLIPVWFRTIDSKQDPEKPSQPFRKTHNTTWDESVGRYVDGLNPDKLEEIFKGKRDAAKQDNPNITDEELARIKLDSKEIKLARDKDFVYDIACAELCGWGHYRMIGRVYVHENQADFLEWLKKAEKSNRQRTRD